MNDEVLIARASGVLTLTPLSIDFGTVGVGASKDLTFNEGNHYEYNVWDGVRASYQGPNDLFAPALLTDPAHGNFAPAPGSPALRSGTATRAPANDYSGAPRPASSIDRGAVQVSR